LKVSVMFPINSYIKHCEQMIDNARQTDDTDDYEKWSKEHHHLTVMKDLGLNFIEISTEVYND
jgi:hypothetical protein